jgi:hypothetical protein
MVITDHLTSAVCLCPYGSLLNAMRTACVALHPFFALLSTAMEWVFDCDEWDRLFEATANREIHEPTIDEGRSDDSRSRSLEWNGCDRVVGDASSGAGCPHAVGREEPQAPDGLVVAQAGLLAVAQAPDGLVVVPAGFLAVVVVPAGLVVAQAGVRAVPRVPDGLVGVRGGLRAGILASAGALCGWVVAPDEFRAVAREPDALAAEARCGLAGDDSALLPASEPAPRALRA